VYLIIDTVQIIGSTTWQDIYISLIHNSRIFETWNDILTAVLPLLCTRRCGFLEASTIPLGNREGGTGVDHSAAFIYLA